MFLMIGCFFGIHEFLFTMQLIGKASWKNFNNEPWQMSFVLSAVICIVTYSHLRFNGVKRYGLTWALLYLVPAAWMLATLCIL